MTVAEVATVATLRTELLSCENDEQSLQQELERVHREVGEAQVAGVALLSAVEASMAPLMMELAAARRHCGEVDLTKAIVGEGAEASEMRAALGNSVDSLEAELQHLQVDIGYYQERAEALQTEERQRAHELQHLRRGLEQTAEELSYEKKRHISFQSTGGGVRSVREKHGRRLETETEEKLCQAAEQRSGRLYRDINRLANATISQQATIKFLSKKLEQVRKESEEHDRKLVVVSQACDSLSHHLRGDVPVERVDSGPRRDRLKKKHNTASTGKLPRLSF